MRSWANKIEVNPMKTAQLRILKFFALLFILPGLAGLIISATISTHYLDTMPTFPAVQELRTVPRNIHGTVVYQTEEENRRLNEIEYGSVGVFLIGVGLGLTYLEVWGARQAQDANEEDSSRESARKQRLRMHCPESASSGRLLCQIQAERPR
jgi:hypothetical protein